MSRKRYTPEQIIGMLREAEVLLSQGRTTGEVCRHLGVSEQLRDDLLNGEIFYIMEEAKALIEQWRHHYNTIRPHSSLGYKAPAPETILPAVNSINYVECQPPQEGWLNRQTLS